MDSKKLLLVVFALVLLTANAVAVGSCYEQAGAVWCDGKKITQIAGQVNIQTCQHKTDNIYMCHGDYAATGPVSGGRINGMYVVGDYAVWVYADNTSAAYYTTSVSNPGTHEKLTQNAVDDVWQINALVYENETHIVMGGHSGAGFASGGISHAYIVDNKFVYAYNHPSNGIAYYTNDLSDVSNPPGRVSGYASKAYAIREIVTMNAVVPWHGADAAGGFDWSDTLIAHVYLIDDRLIYSYGGGASNIAYYMNKIPQAWNDGQKQLTQEVGRSYPIRHILYGPHRLTPMAARPSWIGGGASHTTTGYAGIIGRSFVFAGYYNNGGLVSFFKNSLDCPQLYPMPSGNSQPIAPTPVFGKINDYAGNYPGTFSWCSLSIIYAYRPVNVGEYQYQYCDTETPSCSIAGTSSSPTLCNGGFPTTASFDPRIDCGNNGGSGGDPPAEPDPGGTNECEAWSSKEPEGCEVASCEETLPCVGMPDGTVCGTETETQCSNTSCGGDVIERRRDKKCVSEVCLEQSGTEEWKFYQTVQDCHTWQKCNVGAGACEFEASCTPSIIDLNALSPIYNGNNAKIDVNLSHNVAVTIKILNPITNEELNSSGALTSKTYHSYTDFWPTGVGNYKVTATIEQPCSVCNATTFFSVIDATGSGEAFTVPETDIVLVAIVGLLVVAIVRVKRN